MNTLLFAVGIFVFMITVYGVVMAGGFRLRSMQRDDLAPDTDWVVNDDGWEVIVTHPDTSRNASADAHRHQRVGTA